ncbi:hypothetical protein D3C81_609990 [compost metagenome]
MLEVLGGKGGERAEQQHLLAIDHPRVQVRYRHRRRADRGLAVQLGLVAGDQVGVVGHQELATDREAGIAFGFRDARLLQQLQRATTGTDEHEAGVDGLFLAAVGQVGHPHMPGTVVVAHDVAHFMTQVQRHIGVASHRREQLAGDFAKVHVGADGHARGGDFLLRVTAFHHQRCPLADLFVVFGDFHAAEQRAVLQGVDALVQEGDVVITPDKAHVRHVVDERLRVAQHVLLDLVGPELLGDLELLVDADRLADVDLTVGAFAGVVQLAERGVTGTGVVPGVGAFFGHLVQAFVDVDLPGRLQLGEVGAQAGTHDATADQQHVDGLFRFRWFGAADDAQAEERQQEFLH